MLKIEYDNVIIKKYVQKYNFYIKKEQFKMKITMI